MIVITFLFVVTIINNDNDNNDDHKNRFKAKFKLGEEHAKTIHQMVN